MNLKRILLFIMTNFFLFCGGNEVHATYSITSTPTLDFGTVTYLYGTSGFNTVIITDGSGISTGGSGAFLTQDGGAVGDIGAKSNSSFGDLIYSMYIRTTNSTSQEIDSPGCGKITISNFTTDSGSTSTSSWFPGGTHTFKLGATLTVDRVDATSSCTITGTVANAFQWSRGSSG